MTDAPALLAYLRSGGYSVTQDGDAVVVSPASRLTDAERAAVREHKPALLAELERERHEAEADAAFDAATAAGWHPWDDDYSNGAEVVTIFGVSWCWPAGTWAALRQRLAAGREERKKPPPRRARGGGGSLYAQAD